MDIPPLLIRQIADGKAALILGAGASVGAQHPDGKKAPTGMQLAKLLADQFLGGQYAGSPLSMVAELAISESDLQTVQDFLRTIFEPFTPADFHKLLPEFRWHGIATVNYDLVVERAYADSKLHRLQPIVSNVDRMEDHLRSPKDLLLLKLHGCITKTNDERIPLILTPDQYVTHRRGRSRLFEVFGGWARERTLIFVGTTLADFDLRAVLLEAADDNISRPRFYFLTPSVDEPIRRFWETKKVTMVAGTFAEFLTTLDQKITGMARAVPVPPTKLPIFARLQDGQPALTDATRLVLENDVVFIHAGMASSVVEPRQFYRGFSEGMAAVQQNLDCPRDLTDDVLMDVVLHENPNRQADLVAIHASAGAGKTVFLHRLAWNAACDLDALCLVATRGAGLTPESLAELGDFVAERIYLFVDNIADCHSEVERVIETARRKTIPLTVVAAERTNEWNVSCDDLVPYLARSYRLGYLSSSEIGKLLDLLDKHDALGTLTNQPRALQEEAFNRHAGGQLLVALHEATLGKPFEEIVKNEYEAITPDTARSIYLTICTLNRTGTPVRAGLVSRVHGVGFERFEREFFRPLEHVVTARVGRRGHDMEYMARHPHVAELVFRQVLPTGESRYEQFSKLISTLNVSYESDRSSFRHLMNHRVLSDLLPDHSMVEQLFTLAQERAADDGHVFLHHGMYEMRREGGNLNRAEELLGKAEKLLPHNAVVGHAFAELELILADKATNPLVRENHLKTARTLVARMMGSYAKNAYGYSTAFKVEHMRLRSLLDADASAEAVATAIRNAESVLAEGIQQFPNDAYLLSAEASLAATLGADMRVIAALDKAVKANLRNTHAVARLSQILQASGDVDRAKELLQTAIDAVPFEKRLNYLYARLLMAQEADGNVIEKHLRRAFTEGDRNLEAQFWYARQLYVNGKVSEARERFGKFGEQRMDPLIRNAARGEWLEGGAWKIFAGRVIRWEQYFGFIERDVIGDMVYVRREEDAKAGTIGVSQGDRVRFAIAFNFRGPVAQRMSRE